MALEQRLRMIHVKALPPKGDTVTLKLQEIAEIQKDDDIPPVKYVKKLSK